MNTTHRLHPILSVSSFAIRQLACRNVSANIKHIVGNKQETSRKYPRFLQTPNHNTSISFNIDDKTIHELYLWPFV
jgi:hypothetical protein